MTIDSSATNGPPDGGRGEPPVPPGCRGAVYTRYSTRDQHSTGDQIRECMAWADANGIRVAQHHIFTDEGVSGRTARRKGLTALKAALEADEVDTVIVFATSRLFRKMHKALRFVEEEIIERGKRCVVVSQGIDSSNRDDWLLQLQFAAMLDDHMARTNVKHIQAAHVGLLEKRRVFGSITFGYTGEAVDGETTRKGNVARRLIVDADTSKWVQKVFDWFVSEGMSIRAIARRLNREGAPVPGSFPSGRWNSPVVRRMLSNERYVGQWSYGTNENRMSSTRGYARQMPREEPLGVKVFSDLQIIDEATWQKAQARLGNNHRAGGRKPKDGRQEGRPLLLAGLLYCADHGRPLTVSGTFGKYMSCPACKATGEGAALYSMLDRRLATDLICNKIAELLRADADLVDTAIDICQVCAEAADRPDPTEADELRRREQRLSRHINHLLDLVPETDQDKAETKARIRASRADRATIHQQISELDEALRRPVVVPDPDDVHERLLQFVDVLLRATKSSDPGPLHAARELLTKITGGRIELTQCGERKAQRGWLQATFHLRLLKPILEELGCCCKPGPHEVVTVDIRKPSRAELLAPEARAMYDQGVKQSEIARRLKVNRNTVGKALDASFAAEGTTRPDGRERRWHVSEDQQPRYKFREIADEVMKLYNEDMAIKDIATNVGADRNTVTSTIRWWHEQQGLIAPDGRARRKRLNAERERSPDGDLDDPSVAAT